MLKITGTGSVDGISAISYYTEIIGFVNTAAYSMHLALPILVYGETLIIIVQNLMIVLLIWKYDKSIGMVEKFIFTASLSAYMFVLFSDTMIPEESWVLISSSTVLFGLASRVPQIWSNYQAQSTGQLAFITFILAWTGSAARLGTVFAESDDIWYRMPFCMGFSTLSIILLQFFLYWSKDINKVKSD